MKKTYTVGATVVAGLVALALSAQPASAATASFPKVAKYYSAWFARAMDPCDLATSAYVVSVTNADMPPAGCLQENSDTDMLLTLKWAKLLVTQRGKIVLFGVGLPFGARVRVELDLRFTVPGVKAKQYAGGKTVTFEDQTVECPNLVLKPYGFPVRRSGVVAGVAKLADCLSAAPNYSNLDLLLPNIEILGARLINLDTGKPFAEAGVVR